MANSEQEKQKKDALISLSDLGATQFVEVYYKIMDYAREQIVSFYDSQSSVKWNGKGIAHSLFETFWTQTPPSRHTLISVNAQPIPIFVHSATPTILVSVNGKVSYLGNKQTPFAQTFMIAAGESDNRYKIISDIFRLQSDVFC